MPTIVEQIQHDALDSTIPVSNILRRVKFAAAKLGLNNVEEWVEAELNGYNGKVPDYRIVRGTPRALNPYYGWMPVAGKIEPLARRAIGLSVAAIEDLVRREPSGELMMSYSDEITASLNKQNDAPWATYALFVDRSQFVGILDKVRNLALDWALELERAGIMGNEHSFRQEEKDKIKDASVNISIGSIGSFAGNIGSGNVSGAIAVSDVNIQLAREFAEQVNRHADELEKSGVPKAAFEKSLVELQAEIAKQVPDKSAVRKIVVDIRNAMSGAAGNLIATGVVAMADKLLG